jgi:hypothetical protein
MLGAALRGEDHAALAAWTCLGQCEVVTTIFALGTSPMPSIFPYPWRSLKLKAVARELRGILCALNTN